jgi:uncharacterized protein with HEPN domain
MEKPDFLASPLVQDAVLRNLEILGEAAHSIELNDSQFASKYPLIPLRDIIAMRNQLVHGYFAVNLSIVWATLQEDIPGLKKLVQQVTARCQTRLIARSIRVNLCRPCIDAALQRLHILKALIAQPDGDVKRPHAVVADGHDVGFRVKLLKGAGRHVSHGHERASFDPRGFVLPGLADIEQYGCFRF